MVVTSSGHSSTQERGEAVGVTSSGNWREQIGKAVAVTSSGH